MPDHNTALLVMDVQDGIVDRIGDAADLLERLQRAMSAARANGIHVIYVKVAFRAGYPEVHRVLLENVFPRQATVTDLETWSNQPG